MRKAKQVCREMIYGVGIYGAVILIVLTLIAKGNPAMPLGVCIGIGMAVVMILHMYRHLDIALDLPPKKAQMHTMVSAFVRMFLSAAVMAGAFVFYQYVHPAGVVFGLLGIKASALMYPKLHKILEKRKEKSN